MTDVACSGRSRHRRPVRRGRRWVRCRTSSGAPTCCCPRRPRRSWSRSPPTTPPSWSGGSPSWRPPRPAKAAREAAAARGGGKHQPPPAGVLPLARHGTAGLAQGKAAAAAAAPAARRRRPRPRRRCLLQVPAGQQRRGGRLHQPGSGCNRKRGRDGGSWHQQSKRVRVRPARSFVVTHELTVAR